MNEIAIEKYPTYKNSGVEWLGDIPEHWVSIRMKYLFKDVSMKNRPGAELLSVTQDKGVVPRSWVENRMVMPSGDLDSFKFIEKGDFAISLRSFEGGLEFCHHDGIISPAYTVLKAKQDLENRFYKYLFKSASFISELQTSVVGIRQGKNISYEELCYSILPIPTSEEQTAIADFLDRKTAQIDKAIAQKEQLIALLKERRQILIHKAVTRGLDPTVPMKDSGVEWIGEIPAHWRLEKLKHHFNLVGGGTPSKDRNDFWDGEIPWVSPKDMKFDYISDTEDKISTKGLQSSATSLIPVGTLLMVVRSGILQRLIPVAISSVQLSINQDMKAFVPVGNIETDFLFWFIRGCDSFLRNEWVKQVATVESIEIPVMMNYSVAIPPPDEQHEIISLIHTTSLKVSKVVSHNQKEIEKLKEYKATLINAAVTGKIKVC